MVKRFLSFALGLVVAAATASPAATRSDTTAASSTEHQVITAGNRYAPGDSQTVATPAQVIFPGDSLTHTNVDAEQHDLQAIGSAPDGNPWFDSPLIGSGETASVAVESVPPGIYSYTCSIHAFMRGRLEIRDPSPPPTAGAGEIEVSSGDSFFSPKTITVAQGTTVRWKNNGTINHTVTSRDGSWDSSPACPTTGECWGPGETFSQTFNSVGSFQYYCKLHGTPQGSGHAGVVQVVPPGVEPTSINSVATSVSGTSVGVSGSATFHGESPVTITQDAPGDGPAGAADTGLDLLGVTAYQPDPALPFVFFEWHVASLPSSGSLPEAIRYTIPFRAGNKAFRIQAKLTDAASTHAADLERPPVGSFELQGNCTTNNPAPATCTRLASLNGSFDTLNRLVRVKVPVGVVPELVPGASLARNTIGSTELTRIQAAYTVVGTAASDDAEWGGSDAAFEYTIPRNEVILGIAPPGTPGSSVVFDTPATVDGSTFSGSVAAPGSGSWDVWVKACFGTNCTTTLRRVTV